MSAGEVGYAEQEDAVRALSRHYTGGRLDVDAFDDRVRKARAATTRAGLAVLFADLPEPYPAALRDAPTTGGPTAAGPPPGPPADPAPTVGRPLPPSAWSDRYDPAGHAAPPAGPYHGAAHGAPWPGPAGQGGGYGPWGPGAAGYGTPGHDLPPGGAPGHDAPGSGVAGYGAAGYGTPGYGTPDGSHAYGTPGYGSAAWGHGAAEPTGQGYRGAGPAYPPHPGPPVYGGHDPAAPFGREPYSGVPYSDKQKLVAGLLQLFLPFGIGRFYAGHTGLAVAQLLVTFLTFGLGAIWSFVDGIVILAGSPRDPAGRPLRP